MRESDGGDSDCGDSDISPLKPRDFYSDVPISLRQMDDRLSPTQRVEETTVNALRARGDDGVAIVEFAFIGPLFILLAIGLINFGLLLNFKQAVTDSAGQGARSAVGLAASTDREQIAFDSVNDGVTSAVDRSCTDPGAVPATAANVVSDGDGLACGVVVHDCVADTTAITIATMSTLPDDPSDNDDCITVRVEHDNDSDHVEVPIPLMAEMIPGTFAAQATSKIED